MPQEREVINTQVFLETRETRAREAQEGEDEQELLSAEENELGVVAASSFKADRETKIIIHGFIDTGFVPWVKVR